LLPSRDDQSAVLRTELDAETAAAGHFGRDHGGATAQELVKDHVTLQRLMEDRAPHALDRLCVLCLVSDRRCGICQTVACL
jgi:hypothetical protein